MTKTTAFLFSCLLTAQGYQLKKNPLILVLLCSTNYVTLCFAFFMGFHGTLTFSLLKKRLTAILASTIYNSR